MNQLSYFAGICIVFFIAVAAAGCLGNGPAQKSSPEQAATLAPAENLSVTDAQNGATVTVSQGSFITVSLPENPTTGFRWNMTVTPGLNVVNDTYIPTPVSPGIVGSGGTRTWEITASAKGNQSMSAVYARSWEPVTGNETGFTMNVIVQ